jgi:hypothetical protein
MAPGPSAGSAPPARFFADASLGIPRPSLGMAAGAFTLAFPFRRLSTILIRIQLL